MSIIRTQTSKNICIACAKVELIDPSNIGMEPSDKQYTARRPIVVEAHILAYLGNYMRTFEESIKRKVKSQCTSAQSQLSQSNTASAHNHS